MNDVKGDDDEADQEQLKKGQLVKGADSRTINSLPFYSSRNYSPYFMLEFDLAVQDYCRNQTNLMNLNKCLLGQQPASSALAGVTNQNKSNKQSKKRAAKLSHLAIGRTQSGNEVARCCKVVVSGDVAVGKTCLVNRFGHAVYTSTYQTTIGVDFDLQKFSILGQPYMLQIWDTAGLERFKCITSSYYRGCQVAIIVFDMSNMSSLANVFKWRDEILASSKTFEQLSSELESLKLSERSHKSSASGCRGDEPLLFLVGTKCDLPLSDSRRLFMTEQANKIAAQMGAELWFVSAQTGENVEELFTRLAALAFNRSLLSELQQLKFDASTMGACLKEKLIQQQRELWSQSSKLIKITRRKDGDERRTRCVNVQCVIK